jgi:hypothetical protein
MSLICFYSIQGGGESLEQLYIRAQSAMEEIAEKHHGMSSSTTAMFGNSNWVHQEVEIDENENSTSLRLP